MTPSQTFGQYVRYERLRRGISKAQLASKIRISRGVLVYLEDSNSNRSISLDYAFKILAGLNRTMDDFEYWKENKLT